MAVLLVYVNCVYCVFQSGRVDFVKLMLDANKAGIKAASEAELEMTVDGDESEKSSTENGQQKDSARILKRMTLEVRVQSCSRLNIFLKVIPDIPSRKKHL